jgi:hypothetical protein
MIPVFLLGSAIFLVCLLHLSISEDQRSVQRVTISQGLQLTQLKLSHEKFMEESTSRVTELEAEISVLQQKRDRKQPTSEIAPTSEKNPSRWRWW